MKETVICKKVITYGDEFLAEMEICYILKEGEYPRGGYGVRLIKESIENGARISEDNQTPLIFESRKKAMEYLNILIKYEVTPIALDSVTEDYLCDRKEQTLSA